MAKSQSNTPAQEPDQPQVKTTYDPNATSLTPEQERLLLGGAFFGDHEDGKR